MADKIGEIYVEINARLDKLEQANKKAEQSSKNSAKKIEGMWNSAFGSIGKAAGMFGIGFGLVEGVKALSRFLGDSVQAAKEAAIAQAKVSQAVKTTGGAAGFTTNQLKQMASELQTIAGIDDDQILNDVTLQLLTFTNISGTAFKRAQAAALDLSAVLGSDLLSQTIQLGKALEDPVKGITALQRVGITFTETQKAQIASFMKANDLMSAQSLILTEIETKYGGQAAEVNKASGATKNYNVALGELKETIGDKLKPVQDAFLSILTDIFSVFTKLTAATKESNSEWDIQKEKVIALRGELKKYRDDQSKPQTFNGAVPTLNTKIPFFNVTDNLQGLGKIESEATKTVENIVKEVKELTEEQKQSLADYYSAVKFKDKDYYNYRINLINEQVKKFKAAGISEVDAQKYINDEKKKLAKEQFDWEVSLEKKKLDEAYVKSRAGKVQVKTAGQLNLAPKQLQSVGVGDKPEVDAGLTDYEQAEEDAQIKRAEVWQAGNQAVQDGLNSLFDGLQIKIQQNENAFVKMAKVMVNSFTQAISQMIAKYAALELLKAIPGFGPVAALFAHDGGTFQNGKKIASFANGGAFTVPTGYPNDSFPMMVESGERVRVTPSGRAGDEAKLLAQVVSSIQALNMNLVRKNMQPVIVSNVDGLQFVQGTTAPATNRLNKAGVQLDAIR
jgi:hypothetical protein